MTSRKELSSVASVFIKLTGCLQRP